MNHLKFLKYEILKKNFFFFLKNFTFLKRFLKLNFKPFKRFKKKKIIFIYIYKKIPVEGVIAVCDDDDELLRIAVESDCSRVLKFDSLISNLINEQILGEIKIKVTKKKIAYAY